MDKALNTKTLLIVEDEGDVRSGIKNLLTSLLGIKVLEASDGKSALDIIKINQVNAILTDIRMEPMDGIEFISCAKAIGVDVPVIFFSAYADKDNALKALRLGAFEFIEKPFQMSHLVNVIKAALLQENLSLTAKLQTLNLSSKQIKILELLLQGKINREIADAVDLTEPTVKYHVGTFLKQFAASNRFELKEKIWSMVESKSNSDSSPIKSKSHSKLITTLREL